MKPSLNAESMWQAVECRDADYDGVFVYAVRSTGIYCRPSCPSRRPRREQVTFYESGEAAQAGGFRACRRCHPDEALPQDQRAALVLRVCRRIEADPAEPPALEEMASLEHISPSYLQRIFKSATGLTPRQYAQGKRLEMFKSQVRAGGKVADAMYDAGFSSVSRLYERSNARLGMSPAVYQRGGRGMDITYTIVETRLGRMLVAATHKGVCAVSFAGSDEELIALLRAEYPAANLRREGAPLQAWVRDLTQHLEGSLPRLALPLDVQATTFQLRVWEELREIPYGETRTYAQVAKAIGQPKAVRAVARACATNPAAVLTPCHRVVRSDGGLGGYRWGIERKEALLAQEKRK